MVETCCDSNETNSMLDILCVALDGTSVVEQFKFFFHQDSKGRLSLGTAYYNSLQNLTYSSI
jgi:hypothetical protein